MVQRNARAASENKEKSPRVVMPDLIRYQTQARKTLGVAETHLDLILALSGLFCLHKL